MVKLTILDRTEPETMAITLEHVLVPANDREASARFISDVLGVEYLGLGSTAGPPAFARVRVGPTTLDFVDTEGFEPEHYAFKVSDEDLDAILARVRNAGLSFYVDPGHQHEGELNHWNGGRGFYFSDPNDGHNMELLTHPA
jgi:catechol 2,3-dioxygenase-like lactoylglutathione lyase family enzyme